MGAPEITSVKKDYDFVMEKFGRHHLHQVMQVSITNNGTNEHQALTHGIQWRMLIFPAESE